MDTPKPLGTIIGSLVQHRSPESLPPSENEQKLAVLLQLGSHFWTPDFTPSQAKHLLADYLDDLADFRMTELEIACRIWRRNAANKRFPRSGELISGILAYRRERKEEAERKPVRSESRPIMWWMLPRKCWKSHWREHEAPDGAFVYDMETGKRRAAYRFS